mmetsp:Transcript_39419/g.115141  ORF Transcript_39419/g.115141 Transcript_39419/m.115141 type:complete len:270 (-) Transcript_39419:372-1181(-)
MVGELRIERHLRLRRLCEAVRVGLVQLRDALLHPRLLREPRVQIGGGVGAHVQQREDTPPAFVAKDPLWVEREAVALWHAREQELLDGALAQVAPRDGVEALPHHEVLGVHFLRKVVVEALGAVPYRARQVEAMDGAFEDGGRRRVAVAKRRERRREAAFRLLLEHIQPPSHPAARARRAQHLGDSVERPVGQRHLLRGQRLDPEHCGAHQEAIDVRCDRTDRRLGVCEQQRARVHRVGAVILPHDRLRPFGARRIARAVEVKVHVRRL